MLTNLQFQKTFFKSIKNFFKDIKSKPKNIKKKKHWTNLETKFKIIIATTCYKIK